MDETQYWKSLPKEIQTEIFNHCDLATFLRFTETARISQIWLDEECIWKGKSLELKPDLDNQNDNEDPPRWRQIFMRIYEECHQEHSFEPLIRNGDASTALKLVNYTNNPWFLERLTMGELDSMICASAHRLENQQIRSITPKDPTELYEALFRFTAYLVYFFHNHFPNSELTEPKDARSSILRARKGNLQRQRDSLRAQIFHFIAVFVWDIIFILTQTATLQTQIVTGLCFFFLLLLFSSPMEPWNAFYPILFSVITGNALMWRTLQQGLYSMLPLFALPLLTPFSMGLKPFALYCIRSESFPSKTLKYFFYLLLYAAGWLIRLSHENAIENQSILSVKTLIFIMTALLQCFFVLSILMAFVATNPFVISTLSRRIIRLFKLPALVVILIAAKFCRIWRLNSVWAYRIGELVSNKPPQEPELPSPRIRLLQLGSIAVLILVTRFFL